MLKFPLARNNIFCYGIHHFLHCIELFKYDYSQCHSLITKPMWCGVEITRVVYVSIYCVVNLNFGKCVINKKWPSNSFRYKQRILFALLFYRSDKISWQHLILLSMKFACNKRSLLVNWQIFTRHINTRHSQKKVELQVHDDLLLNVLNYHTYWHLKFCIIYNTLYRYCCFLYWVLTIAM